METENFFFRYSIWNFCVRSYRRIICSERKKRLFISIELACFILLLGQFELINEKKLHPLFNSRIIVSKTVYI